jgi:dienelactone hydrolase
MIPVLLVSLAMASPPAPGTHQLRLDDGTRYTVRAPAAGSGKAPLVLVLHWGGPVSPWTGRGLLEMVAPTYAPLGAWLVAPDAPDAPWTSAEGEAAAMAVLDHAVASWPVDPARVVVTGFSMGGIGTWHLVGRHPERFCAAVPMASRPGSGASPPPVPVFAVQSKRDELFEVAPVTEAVAGLAARGVRAEVVVLDGPTHYDVAGFLSGLERVPAWLVEGWAAGAPVTGR